MTDNGIENGCEYVDLKLDVKTDNENSGITNSQKDNCHEYQRLFATIKSGKHVEVHKLLHNEAADPNLQNTTGRSGLHVAALEGFQDIFKLLLNYGANPDLCDSAGVTPLMCASQKGSEVIVDTLLLKGVDVAKKTKDGLSAVFYALNNGHRKIAEKLEQNKSCIHDLQEKSFVSIYEMAVRNNWTGVVKFMAKNQCEISYSHKVQLATQASLRGHTEMLQYFKVAFAERTEAMSSPLRCAVQNGFIDAVKYMLDNKCDVSNASECSKAAIINNHLDILKLLLDGGVPMFKPETDESTPVQLAIEFGSFELFKYLVEQLGCSLKPNARPVSLAHIAASHRKVEVLRYLIENRISVSQSDPETGETPLLIACQRGPFEAVELLLKSACDPNASNRRGVTPALRAAHCKQDEILMLLGEKGADLDIPNRSGETAILCAARNKSLSMVRYLVDKNCSLSIKDVHGRTIAYYAVQTNNVALLNFLQRRSVSLDEPNANGVTPLMTAITHGALDAVKLLISTPNLCNINHRDWNGRTAMHVAVSLGKLEIVQLLFEKGACLNVSDIKGNTPLLDSLTKKKAYDTLLFLINNGSDMQATNKDLRNVMHYACMHEENDAMMMLLDAGCPFDTSDRFGMTPFIISAAKGSESLTTILKAVGADVNARNVNGENAVHMAAKSGNLKIVQSFSLIGCDLDQEDRVGVTPLIIACKTNNKEMVEFLIRKKADINTVTHSGETAAHFACQSGSLCILELLHTERALLDQPDLNGVTPILVASAKQNVEVLTYLCNKGCDLSRKDKTMSTALHHAVKGKNESVIQFLIDKGLDPNELDGSGTSAVLLSIKLNLTSILATLRSKGGIVNDIFDSNSCSAAHFACQVGNLNFLQEPDSQVSFSSRTSDKENCLTIACSNGHEEIVKFLLDHRQYINFKNSSGANCLHIAAKKSHLTLIPLLIRRGIHVKDKTSDGNTVIHILCHKQCSSKAEKVERRNKEEMGNQLDPTQQTDNLPFDCVDKKTLIEQLKSLFSAGLDVNERNKAGKCPLHYACIHGSKSVINLLISNGAKVDLADVDGETPIFTAIRQGKEKAVSLLIKHEANLTVTNKNGLSPLGLAVALNNNQIMQILTTEHKQFDATATLRHVALDKVFQQHNLNHLDFLMSHGFDGKKSDNGKTLLHYVVMTGDVRLLKSLTDTQKYTFVKEIIDVQDTIGDTALHLAVMRERFDMAKILIDSGCRVDMKNQKGHTVLHVAASNNKLYNVKWVMENCKQKIYDPQTTELEETPSPLHLAAIKGNLEVFKYLEQEGFSAASKCKKGNNCAHYAATHGNLHVLEHLQRSAHLQIAHTEALFSAKNDSAFTPLECAVRHGHETLANFLYREVASVLPEFILHLAVQLGNQHMVKWAQSRGASLEEVHQESGEILRIAISAGNFHLTKLYIDDRCSITARAKHGNTVSHAAAAGNYRHLLKLLRDKGAPLDISNSDGDTEIGVCAINGHLDFMKMLLEFECNLRHRNAKQRDIVHLASIGSNMKGHLNIIKFACDKEVPLDEADDQGNSGLMYACRQGFKDIAEFLLSKDCNPNRENNDGTTPAHLAVMAGRADILDLLSQHGARLDAKDKDGTTPLMIAES